MLNSETLYDVADMPEATPQMQWFCHLALVRRLIDHDALLELLAHQTEESTPLSVAQSAIDEGLCNDLDELNQALEDAWDYASTGYQAPPLHILYKRDLQSVFRGFETPSPPADEAAREAMLQLVGAARQRQVSDIHITAGNAPSWRRWGMLERLSENPLSMAGALALNLALLPKAQREQIASKQSDLIMAMNLPDGMRCRVNMAHHHLGTAGTYRLIPDRVVAPVDLGLYDPGPIEKLLDHHSGIVLVSGPSGSGKTTTLASLVQTIAAHRLCHIIALESPIEIIHQNAAGAISQREVGMHTTSYARALKAALREDPDIIVIGELQDRETVELALTAAETGHLVLGTMHANSCAGALNRILNSFSPSRMTHVRGMMGESLRGIICQNFLPSTDGTLALAYELLINTHAVGNLIREGRTYHLEQVMQTSIAEGMQTMDRSIKHLYQEARIDRRTAQSLLKEAPSGAETDTETSTEAEQQSHPADSPDRAAGDPLSRSLSRAEHVRS